jgi:site-specific DNA recombinase
MTATKSQSKTTATLYLRLSDFRDDSGGFSGREARLRAEAARLGWTVGRVVVENDVSLTSSTTNGRTRPASAFKRDSKTGRVIRPGFRSIVDDLRAGRTGAMLCEDLDRAARDPRDLEDLVDAVAASGASARSLSGSLTLTAGGTDSEITMARIMVTMANKASRDNARRVSAKRGDLAAAGSYGGGIRPFGFRPDLDAPKYAKTLLQVPAEAAEIRAAADAVMAGVSLKAVARDLRDRGVPTVKGGKWSAEILRDVLMKPAVAALVPAGGELMRASWEPILEREQWEAVCAKLSEPTVTITYPSGTTYTGPRITNTRNANEPRHLLSGIATCYCGAPVKAGGGKGGRSYLCTASNHLRRTAAPVDELVLAFTAEYIQQQGADLLRPPARPGVDTRALRAESARLTAIGERQAAMHGLGEISDAELRAGSRARKARLDAIAGQLAAQTEVDQLGEFRDQPDAGEVLAGLPLPRQRAVVRLLVDVTLKRATRRGQGFDEDSVEVGPVAQRSANDA